MSTHAEGGQRLAAATGPEGGTAFLSGTGLATRRSGAGCAGREPHPSDLRTPLLTPTAAMLPGILSAGRADAIHEGFVEEYGPVGPTESALVADLARHAAAAEAWAAACDATQRRAARTIPLFAIGAGELDGDALLAGAMTAEATDRCERNAARHTRGFYRALAKLEEVQGRRGRRASGGVTAEPPAGFGDEAACEAYLVRRFRRGAARCRNCGAASGCHIASRKAWECFRCGGQTGLRAGTVTARSPLGLWPWFEAIRWVLWRPDIGPAQLALKIRIRRLTTVRDVGRRIRRAAVDEDRGVRLAGLDVHYASRSPGT